MLKLIILRLLAPAVFCIPFAVNAQNDNRQEYKSIDYQISLKYPKSWRLTNSWGTDGIVAFRSPVVKDGDQINAASIVICSQPLGINLSAINNCHRSDEHLSDNAKDVVISRKKIKIDGIEAEKIETKKQFFEIYHYYVSFTSGSRNYFIKGIFKKSQNDVWDTFKYEPEFNNLVESIKLVGANDVDNFQLRFTQL